MTIAAPSRGSQNRVWIVDPLDGTREYGEGRDDWAVHVALAIDGVAAVGAVALPGLGLTLTSGAPAPLQPANQPLKMLVAQSCMDLAIEHRYCRRRRTGIADDRLQSIGGLDVLGIRKPVRDDGRLQRDHWSPEVQRSRNFLAKVEFHLRGLQAGSPADDSADKSASKRSTFAT